MEGGPNVNIMFTMFRRCRYLSGGRCTQLLVFAILVVVLMLQLGMVQQNPAICEQQKLDYSLEMLKKEQEQVVTTPLPKQTTTIDLKNPATPHCDPRVKAEIVGNQRNHTVYMTIGIPSIYRLNTTDGAGYINTTLTSLVTNLRQKERDQVTILVFLSDFNRTFTDTMIRQIRKYFSPELDSGLLLLMRIPERCYPQLDGLPRTYNDAADRVKWRSKQVVDYAFLWQYASNISTYYIQLEDDVITCRDYLSKIKMFVLKQKDYWALLEFAELGYIGKFYKAADLRRQAQFVLTFYYHKPIDWLLGYFRDLMTQNGVKLRKPALFDHIGHRSSLHGSINPLKEKTFQTK